MYLLSVSPPVYSSTPRSNVCSSCHLPVDRIITHHQRCVLSPSPSHDSCEIRKKVIISIYPRTVPLPKITHLPLPSASVAVNKETCIFSNPLSESPTVTHVKPVNVVFTCNNCNMSLWLMVRIQSLRISRKAIKWSSYLQRHMCRISGQSKKTLSNNSIKCGKPFIGYSTIN